MVMDNSSSDDSIVGIGLLVLTFGGLVLGGLNLDDIKERGNRRNMLDAYLGLKAGKLEIVSMDLDKSNGSLKENYVWSRNVLYRIQYDESGDIELKRVDLKKLEEKLYQ